MILLELKIQFTFIVAKEENVAQFIVVNGLTVRWLLVSSVGERFVMV